MKADVLFDSTGAIIAMMHPSSDEAAKASGSADQQFFSLVAEPGSTLATLEIPGGLESLSAVKRHDALRVDLSQGAPRLVAK